jgi:ADP-heptose:LPS heptosyltransferase
MYGALAASLANEINRPVIVLWGAGEEHLRDTVLAVSHSNLVFPAPRTDLAQMTELIRRSGLLVTNDTGPLHLAVALGVPTVSIFGPSDPRRNGPYYSSGHRVVRADVPCLECWKTVCPAQDTLCCMRGVTVESVLSAALEVLS